MKHFEEYDEAGNRRRVAQLRDAGVDVWGPERVYVAADVRLDNIEPGASIHQATLAGAELRIGRGARIGASGHALVSNCQVGREVELGTGSYEGATILDGTRVRGYAELRPGTLLEEQVEAAHTVAFKNTVLTATVVTGSVMNYCDIFMSGGRSRTEHSEVGSGVVHFNFDPRGDKWSSLIGDARGVLLRSRAIFVGGNCGLVSPLHVDFGAAVAAGSTVRRDVEPNCVYFESAESKTVGDFDPEIYTGLHRKFLMTAKLVGNLWALDAWYEKVRLPFAEESETPLYEAAREQIRLHIAERVKRLGRIIEKLGPSIEKAEKSGSDKLLAFRAEHRMLIDNASAVKQALTNHAAPPAPPSEFLKQYEAARKSAPHVEAVRRVKAEAASSAEAWLLKRAAEPETALQRLFDSVRAQ